MCASAWAVPPSWSAATAAGTARQASISSRDRRGERALSMRVGMGFSLSVRRRGQQVYHRVIRCDGPHFSRQFREAIVGFPAGFQTARCIMQEHADPVGMPPFKRLELEGWQEQAATYDGQVGQLTREADKHLIDTVELRPGMRLLDICSGPGYGAGLAAERGAKACGIDFAPAMVEQAKRRFPNVEFRSGDAEALDFPDASFDAAICPFGLMHLNDPDRAIAEAFRVLKPGARYGFAAWSVPEKAELLGLALKVLAAEADMTVPMPPGPPFFQHSDPAFAKAALERAGFVRA